MCVCVCIFVCVCVFARVWGGERGGVLQPENDASGSVFVYSVPWLGAVQCFRLCM